MSSKSGERALAMSPLIFRPGLKYTIRHTYTVAAVAGAFAVCACVGAYRAITWASKSAPIEATDQRDT